MSTSYTQKCPHCGNIVEGKIQRSTTSRAARNVLKKGGMKTALTLAGSVVPGFGNVAGFVAGTAIDAIWGDKINNAVDEAADIFVEDNKYSFCCPNCGKQWVEELAVNVDEQSEEEIDLSSWDDIAAKVLDIIVKELTCDIDAIDDATYIKELGASRSQITGIKVDIENALGVEIPSDFLDNNSVKELVDAIFACKNPEENGKNDNVDDEITRFDSFFKSYLDDEYSSMTIESRIAMFIREAETTPSPYMQAQYYRLAAVASLEAFCGELSVRFKNYPDPDEQLKLQELCLVQGLECIDKCSDQDKSLKEDSLIKASLSLLKDFWYDEKYNSTYYIEAYGNIEEDYKDEEDDSLFNREWLLSMFQYGYQMILSVLSQQGKAEPESAVTNDAEQEYLDELKEILADGEISPRERRLLEKIRVQLGISSERALQLEQSVAAPALSEEEQEYLDEYKEIIADGEISARDQRFLDKLKKANGISEERAQEIESMA